jgi:hypothetical protein
VIPDYTAGTDYELPETAEERRYLEQRFEAEAVEPRVGQQVLEDRERLAVAPQLQRLPLAQQLEVPEEVRPQPDPRCVETLCIRARPLQTRDTALPCLPSGKFLHDPANDLRGHAMGAAL